MSDTLPQLQIKQETGATVISKGTWLPDRTKATDKEPALYLHITAPTQEILNAGIAAVQKVIDTELGPLVTDFRARAREEQPPRERRRWPEEKIPVNLESLRNFNVRAKIVGPQGLFVKHIQQETSARVQIKGRGSGYIENETGRESDEPMHIHISGPEQIMVDQAKDLAEDLLAVVREEWEKARVVMDQYNHSQQAGPYAQYQQPPPPSYNAPAPPPGGDYPAPPPPVRTGATHPPVYPADRMYPQATDEPQPPPPAPPSAPSQPAPDQATAIAQAQAMAPTIDPSLIQFYAGYSQDPAMIVYYAQMAMYYQGQGYTGSGQPGAAAAGGPPGGPPTQAHDPVAQQYQSMNAYGTPTQGSYGSQQQGYGAAAGPPPANGNYGSPYNPQQQQAPHQSPPRHDAYDDRSRGGRGNYANMPPPPGL